MPRGEGRQKNISLPPFEAKKPKEVRKRKPRASDFNVFNFYIFALRDLFFSWECSHTSLISVLQDSTGISETTLGYMYRQPEVHWQTLSQKILLFLIIRIYWGMSTYIQETEEMLDTPELEL